MPLSILDNFYLTDDELENSPSRQHGIDRETEATLRIYGAELIQEAGILLGFPVAVMATGQVLFQRFYCKRSMKDFNVKKVAATALWLGAKLEEVPEVSQHPERLARKVLLTVDRICGRREAAGPCDGGARPPPPVLEPHTKDYVAFRDALVRYERELLRAFGFIMHVHHPHKQMLNYCQVIGADRAHPALVQEAWNVLNDSLRTTLCLRFRPHVVACGAIFYAARRLGVALPEDAPPWWEVFGVEEGPMCEVARAMHELYARPRAEYAPVFRHIVPSKPPTPVLSPVAGVSGASALRGGTDERGFASVGRGDAASAAAGAPEDAVASVAPPAAAAAVAAAAAPTGDASAPINNNGVGAAGADNEISKGQTAAAATGAAAAAAQAANAEAAEAEAAQAPADARRRSRSRSRSPERKRRRRSRSRSRDRRGSRHEAGRRPSQRDDRGGDARRSSSSRGGGGRESDRGARDRDRGRDEARPRSGGGRSRSRSRGRGESRPSSGDAAAATAAGGDAEKRSAGAAGATEQQQQQQGHARGGARIVFPGT